MLKWDKKYKKMKDKFATEGRPKLIKNAQGMIEGWKKLNNK